LLCVFGSSSFFVSKKKSIVAAKMSKINEKGDSTMKKAVSDLVQKVLMVPPKHFTVEYSINPWMGGTVDQPKAQKQWDTLKQAIEKQGVKVLTLDPVKGLPDMVFVCNSGIIHDKNVYLSKFRHKERTGEQNHYLEWFKANNYKVFGEDYPEYFEGGGDACFSDYKTLWAGYGSRSNKSVYEKVKEIGDFTTVICDLVDPKFYHLDTCFCPVGSTSALWYPKAFSEATQKEIRSRLPDAIEVDDKEAAAFVCNAITIRNDVISPIGVSEKTKQALSKIGYTVTEVDMSEFMKSGGACQCLILKL
jgi:N-dimethylarginine dimethylaminohydrolase